MDIVKTDVLILGGGVAGLAALKSLRDNGIEDYILLEGGDRLGGRVHSLTSEGQVLELGAGWIHGADMFPLYDLAVESNIKLHKTQIDQASARNINGNNVTNAVHANYCRMTKVCHIVCQLAEQKKIHHDEPDISLEMALELCGWKANTVEEKAIEYLVYDFYYGMDNSKISTRFSFDYDPNEPASADLRVIDEGGFQGFIQCICGMDDMVNPKDTRVILNQIVTDVSYTDHSVEVKTKNGPVYLAKYAIITFSLGVLKNNMVNWTPALPAEKQRCIRDLVMLNYMKVFVAFGNDVKPFWDCTEMILYCSKRKHYFNVWENLNIFGANTCILVGTLMDDEADAAILWSEQELKDNVMQVLCNMYGDIIPEPKWIKKTDWATNPLFHGSFSGKPVGVTKEDLEKFQAPLGRLHFAGEAFSIDSYGDVWGAYSTGLQEGANVACALLQDI